MKLYPEVAKLYVQESGRIRTPASRQTYLKVMRLIQHHWPDRNVDTFTTQDLTTFCLSRWDGSPGQPAPSTIKQRRAHLRATYKWATWKKFCKVDPAYDLEFTVSPGTGQVRLGTWLELADVKLILDSFNLKDQKERRDKLILMTGLFTGLRVMNLAGLKWSDFSSDLSAVTVTVKGNKPLKLGVPPQLREALLAWKKEAWLGAVAVFPSMRMVYDPGKMTYRRMVDWGKPLGVSGLGYAVQSGGDVLGIKLNPHDLRRSFAGFLESKGLPLKDIQLAMGHSQIQTTDNYLKSNPSRTVAVGQELRLDL